MLSKQPTLFFFFSSENIEQKLGKGASRSSWWPCGGCARAWPLRLPEVTAARSVPSEETRCRPGLPPECQDVPVPGRVWNRHPSNTALGPQPGPCRKRIWTRGQPDGARPCLPPLFVPLSPLKPAPGFCPAPDLSCPHGSGLPRSTLRSQSDCSTGSCSPGVAETLLAHPGRAGTTS